MKNQSILKKISKKKSMKKKISLKKKKIRLKLNMENNNLQNLSNLLNTITKKHDSIEVLEILFHFIQRIDNPEFIKFLENTHFFDKKKLGKSGGKVGIINKNYILKYYNLDENKKYLADNEENCIKLYFPFNELIINTILDNFAKKNKKYSNYFIPIKSIGIYHNNSYMISEKVGMEVNETYYTNLEEIIKNNHIPFLLKNISNQKYIDKWCHSLVVILSKYFDCLKFLYSKLGYINTDFKCQNVFIKGNDKKSDLHFISNFTPLVSDLDKATIKLNDIQIMPRPDKVNEKLFSKYRGTRFSKVFEFRYNCTRNVKLCNKFQPHQFDLLTFFYDLYILLYLNIYPEQKKKESLADFISKFEILNRFASRRLNLNQEEFKLFYQRISQSMLLKYVSKLDLALHINAMIYNLCKVIDT